MKTPAGRGFCRIRKPLLYPSELRGQCNATIMPRSFVETGRVAHSSRLFGLSGVVVPGSGAVFRQYTTRGEGRVEIECEWTARKRERTQSLSSSGTAPTQAKGRLEWATRPRRSR